MQNISILGLVFTYMYLFVLSSFKFSTVKLRPTKSNVKIFCLHLFLIFYGFVLYFVFQIHLLEMFEFQSYVEQKTILFYIIYCQLGVKLL